MLEGHCTWKFVFQQKKLCEIKIQSNLIFQLNNPLETSTNALSSELEIDLDTQSILHTWSIQLSVRDTPSPSCTRGGFYARLHYYTWKRRYQYIHFIFLEAFKNILKIKRSFLSVFPIQATQLAQALINCKIFKVVLYICRFAERIT